MSRPIEPSEREEIERIAFECEQSPARLQRYLFELIRLRNVMRVVRSRSRLNPSIERAVRAELPPVSNPAQWCRLAGVEGAPDLAGDDMPDVFFDSDFRLT